MTRFVALPLRDKSSRVAEIDTWFASSVSTGSVFISFLDSYLLFTRDEFRVAKRTKGICKCAGGRRQSISGV